MKSMRPGWWLVLASLVLLAICAGYRQAQAAGAAGQEQIAARSTNPTLLGQTPQPPAPGGQDFWDKIRDQINSWVSSANDRANAESDRLQNELKQRAGEEADKAAQSLKDRAGQELHKLVDQACGGAPAGMVLAGLGLAARRRRRRGPG